MPAAVRRSGRCAGLQRSAEKAVFGSGVLPGRKLELPGSIDGMPTMTLFAALLSIACLAACGSVQTQSEHALVRYDDEWRQRQAVLDAEAIMQGMAQARQRQEELARTAR